MDKDSKITLLLSALITAVITGGVIEDISPGFCVGYVSSTVKFNPDQC